MSVSNQKLPTSHRHHIFSLGQKVKQINHYKPSFLSSLQKHKPPKPDPSKYLNTKMDHKSTALHSTSPSTKQELAPHEIHAQPQSPLYSKLPFEIRMLVFQQMFREAIHVTCIGRNLVSWRCRKQSPDHMPCHWQHPCWDYRRGISNRRKGFLGILTTCKLV